MTGAPTLQPRLTAKRRQSKRAGRRARGPVLASVGAAILAVAVFFSFLIGGGQGSLDLAPFSWLPTTGTVPGPGEMKANELRIGDLGVIAPVVPTRVSGDELALPVDPAQVGWDADSATLTADEGVTLIAGHVTYNNKNGAMYDLADLSPGASVEVTDAAGVLTEWTVTETATVAAEDVDVAIWSTTGPHHLVMVTCTGPTTYINGVRSYRDRIVVWADPKISR